MFDLQFFLGLVMNYLFPFFFYFAETLLQLQLLRVKVVKIPGSYCWSCREDDLHPPFFSP